MLRIRSTVLQIIRNTNTTKSRPFSSTKVCASINLAPTYDINKPQTLEKRKARLVYQSRKRGMLENDLLLSTFAKKYLEGFDEQQTILYDRLINTSNDLDLFYWAVGKEPTPKEFDNEIMHLLKKHAKNEDQQIRLQPDL